MKIRKMTRDDIPAAMRLKDAEKWNQTLSDWDILLGSDSNINFVAEKDGLVVGTVTAINYANEVAWIGMMIVDKAYRGQGISNLLLNAAIEKLKKTGCRCIKLDATPAGQPVYKKLGFVDEYALVRMTNPNLNTAFLGSSEMLPGSAQEKDIGDIVALDKEVFGANRKILVEPLIQEFPQKVKVLIRDDQVTGFALGRDGKRFNQIGPVSASSLPDVIALITLAASTLNGKPVVVDVLESRANLIAWLESLGFTRQRPFYRMYLEENSFPGDIDRQYLICGPEFG